jgi:hypothetical protein
MLNSNGIPARPDPTRSVPSAQLAPNYESSTALRSIAITIRRESAAKEPLDSPAAIAVSATRRCVEQRNAFAMC